MLLIHNMDKMSFRDMPTPKNMSYRTMSVRLSKDGEGPATLDAETRSFEVIGATEDPVEVFDYDRWEVVPEILLMEGCEMPAGRQVPLLDSHARQNIASVLGSFRQMKAAGGQLVGRVFFSASKEAESPYIKAREGHLTDFSVGYRVVDSQWVPGGERAVIRGRSFEGPVRVTTRWRVRELSICPIGADESAKARSVTRQNTGDKKPMDPRLRTYLEKRGLAQGATEDEAWAFLTNLDDGRDAAAERERIISIEAVCRRAGHPELADQLIRDGVPFEQARSRVMDRVFADIDARGDGGGYGHRPPVELFKDEADKRQAAVVDGLCLRAGLHLDKPAPGATEYRGATLVDIARECAIAAGVRTSGMTKMQIVTAALTHRAAYTGDFPLLLAATAGKSLRTAFQEAPSTYQLWCKISSGADFKEMSRVQLSEAPDVDQIPELGKYKYGSLGESAETFQISKFGKLFSISREAIVNDDLDASLRIPLAFARAAKRKINTSVYDILTANAAMADGTALFHADHSNLGGTAGAPSETTLSAGRLAMRKQTGLKGATLNISPRFAIVPAALETTLDKLLNSIADLADNKNAGVSNPFHKKLDPVVESYLDKTSATEWYLSADPAECDTVEVAFLDGQDEPYLETREGWRVDGVEFKVRIEFGVKAIDWRGLHKNPGS